MIGPGGFMMAPKELPVRFCVICRLQRATERGQLCLSCRLHWHPPRSKKRTRNSYHPSAKGGKWITPARRWAIYGRDGYFCVYCDDTVPELGGKAKRLTLDHRRPVAKGGTNASSNLLTCCLSCNSSRKGLSTRLWYRKLASRGINVAKVQAYIRATLRRKVDVVKGQETYERLGRKRT